MDFTYLKPKKVWPVIKDHPDAPSYRTVERWCEGKSHPRKWAEDLMRDELLGIAARKEEAPEPDWVQGLKDELINEIRENRSVITGAIVPQSLVDAMHSLIAGAEGSSERRSGGAHTSNGSTRDAGAGTPSPEP